ncbi:MAG TPA: hypothetical protein VFA76_06840 [Terriglobales bacterium]|nr:hypothetical protein [Terriglobales bacterium]
MLIALLAAPALQAEAGTTIPVSHVDQPCSVILERSASLGTSSVPAGVGIMPSRYEDLSQANEGFKKTGTPLVAFDGRQYTPAGFTDDLGIYYFIPALSRSLHITLAQAIRTFFLFTLIIAGAVGGVGLLISLQSWGGKLVAMFALLLLLSFAYHVGDVYIFECAVPLLLVPWALLLIRKQSSVTWFVTWFVLAGLLCGTASLIRSNAALPTVMFLSCILLFWPQGRISRRLVVLAIFLVAVTIPRELFLTLKSSRDSFLMTAQAERTSDFDRHTFWHLAYIGLGYVSSPYLPAGTCDEVGKAKVRSIAPQAAYLSAGYDQALRSEVFRIVRQHPGWVLASLMAKTGVVVLVIFGFANFGLLTAVLYPKGRAVEIAFWSALSVAAVPLIVVQPARQYLLGLASMATLYGVFSIDQAFSVRALARLRPRSLRDHEPTRSASEHADARAEVQQKHESLVTMR